MFVRSQPIRHLKTMQSHWSYELIAFLYLLESFLILLLLEELESYRYSVID